VSARVAPARLPRGTPDVNERLPAEWRTDVVAALADVQTDGPDDDQRVNGNTAEDSDDG
jgi:hypothetical protein